MGAIWHGKKLHAEKFNTVDIKGNLNFIDCLFVELDRMAIPLWTQTTTGHLVGTQQDYRSMNHFVVIELNSS